MCYTKPMKKKPIAVFDIDGTIFRSSLLIELNAKLVHEGVFPDAARTRVMKVREAWLNRKGTYQEYIDTIVDLYSQDIAGKKVQIVRNISKTVIEEQKHRVYVYTRELIQKLRKTHILIIISFSPLEAVEAFNTHYKFDLISGVPYARKGSTYTGGVDEGFKIDKKKILLEMVAKHGLDFKRSVGVGDTDSDISFLSLVERPIAFNPNKTLCKHAQKKGWEIVVERKDVIYKL